MYKLKLFLNEHKKSFIIIFILIFTVISMQTSLSFKNNKIRALKKEIEVLKTEKPNKLSENAVYSSEKKEEYTEHFFYNKDNTLDNTIIEITKERYINLGKEFGKKYDKDLDGTEVFKFECMNLKAITEKQVKGAVSKLTKENFNVKIEECAIGDTVFYKIKLYE